MEKLKPVIRAAKVVGVGIGAGLLATTDSGPVDNNQNLESQALNDRPGYVQAGESLGTKSLNEAVETVLNAAADKAEAQTGNRFRVIVPLMPRPEINGSNIVINTPTPGPTPTETPVTRRTLEQYLQTAVENTGSRLSKNGHNLKFFDDPNSAGKARAVSDQALRDELMTLLVEDMNDEIGGRFNDLINDNFESLASAPVEFDLQPYRATQDGISVLMGYFGVYEHNEGGIIIRRLGRVWAPIPEDPNEAEIYRNRQVSTLALFNGCASVTGYRCNIGPTPTPDQINQMRDERTAFRNVLQV